MSAKLKNPEQEKRARLARQRAIVYLRDECGYAWREIARAMNMTRWPVEQSYAKYARKGRQT